ncbi:structural maintenance of chromosomes protein 1B isoform X5 [Podarcis raffonei]|uniref:structural maintenance of chromosomes protein 1B isoform X5 n=1 Tax=Podarcis raffonei TaxID=65483 RepID=UPI0023292C9A|nr:structural maintenance of chromosomes protein 1B isoform X5 [Podarcis raffonei]
MGYLQLLMVENFKSWQGKQCIGPFKKFTCVIGPNGSGKSNVMDALSFVMGEKTSNLRVRHIQELIHGAHIGKPVSSTGSVKMVYMEENGEEKTFSRIIRGSGSEFLVNDKIVSRSVYTKELEEIGIIARARNCLVFQGEVETIAMKKPKERTLLFEQISHSGELAAEYAEKKKNMQQSEEEAQFSYNKKKNVAAERKRAKLEKEEAEHYQMMFDKLRECREKLQMFKLYHNEQKINFLNSKLAAKNKDIDSNKTAVSHAEDAVGTKKKALGALNRKQQQIEKEIKSLEILLNQKRPQYIKAKERTSYQIKKVDTAKKDLRDHMKEQAKMEENKKELETELMDIDKAWKAYEKKVEEEALHQGREVLLEESQIRKYKELKELVRKKVAVLTQQLKKLHLEQKADEDKMAFEQRKQREVEASMKQVMEQIEDHEKRIEKLTEYSSTCVESLAEKKQEEVTLTNEIERSKIRMTELNEELNKIVSDLHNAKIDVHEGKRQKTRAENLESLKRLYPGHVFGRLLDLCHPIHKKYQLAVTKVFGMYMVAIVVASEKVARECIRFLKEQRAEAETFLPLDYLKVEPINEQLREIKGTKMMIDVIQTSFPALKKVIQFVCGNGLVCETVQEARQIAFEGPYRLKTVALDGTLFLKSGVISGGSSDLKKKARYWDEKEVNELKEQREKLMNELKVEDNVFGDFCAEIGVDNIRVYEKEHLQEQEEIDKKRFQFENQKTRLSAQLEYICSLVDKAVKKNNMLKENICKDEAYIISLKKDEENFLQMVEEVTVELQQLKERWNVNKADVAEAQNQVEESRKALLTLIRELAKLQKEGIAIETSLEQKKLERHNTFLDCKLQDLKIGLLLGSLDDISEIELGSDTETTEMTADIYEREEAIHVDYSNLAKELMDLRSDKDIETHLTKLQQEIASRENVLSKTAAPNMRALERLHVVTGRFQESVDVFETCRTEARLCRQEFEKVKKKRYELFSQCFEHVSVAIDQIYKKLCRNSSAQAFLSPENPEEPYLEGIGYNCVAPGKRFMPMDNLSGGEKSVAALALVFAIHSFRPAPFFVLDEVDAALDNTNIGKISSFIKEQAQEKFQIIVISLKEEFYSEADALVGVWPEQEDTIYSQVLSLDLTLYRESDDENERQPKGRKSSALKYDIK